ncbi:MAG: thiamine-phosphate kinase [Pelagibacteraceae bacterium TMED267]|nr:MAG: thiamine-phosphate kinase [Pelagibacteraceae bacterium TMED267]
MEENSNKLTEINELGEFGLIKLISKNIKLKNKSSVLGIGDDSAIIDNSKLQTIVSTDMLVEGVHFDLSYFPLKHLGYKSIISSISDIYSMNAQCNQVTVSIAISNRFKVESIQDLYSGINLACKNYGVDLIGGDTTSSNKGILISITAIGSAKKEKIVKRSGAKNNDLIVLTGSLGKAYLGLQVLEREKQVFLVNQNSKPDLSPYTKLIESQLKPEARKDVISFLDENNIIPSSMIDISDGLSSELIHLCSSSKVGCQIYEEKFNFDESFLSTCKEFNLEPSTIFLSGGEDYELLFTINQDSYELIKDNNYFNVIGHITENLDLELNGKDSKKIIINSMGWKSF